MGALGDQKEGIFLFLYNKKTVEDICPLLFFILYWNNPNYNASNQHYHCRSDGPQ